MAQKQSRILPDTLQLDKAYEKLLPNESPYIKNLTSNINGNPNQGIGTNNPTGEGQNMLSLTPLRSNLKLPKSRVPAGGGWNKCIGTFESQTTQEIYYANYNSNGKLGIYVVNGNDFIWQKVIEDIELGFTDNPKAFMSQCRWTLRAVYDKAGAIVEKYLIITNGDSWQKFINVLAAIQTDGFNAATYPYWQLQPPHFDRRELLEYATRPPMYKPEIIAIPNTDEDKGKVNSIVDKAFQICFGFQNTDGRITTTSPYSLPLIVTSSDYLSNPENIPKNAEITFYAGSPLTEKINIYVRQAIVSDTVVNSELVWGAWIKYDTINKFKDCGDNDIAMIGTKYWLRTGAWNGYDYDTTFNTIKYIFDNSRTGTVIDPETIINPLFTEMPIQCKALTDVGDAVLQGNNLYGYPNFSCNTTANLGVEVKYRDEALCSLPTRNIKLYAYVGYSANTNAYISQIGYYEGEDTQMRFGGIYRNEGSGEVTITSSESKYFSLDFSTNENFVLYLKGTPLYTIGKWYQVNSDNSLVAVPSALDASLPATTDFIANVMAGGGYFVCVFDIDVYAGKFIATIGRHNESISGNYRGKSTYIMGIANSRTKSTFGVNTVIRPNALVTYSKEIEVDCTDGNVDVWGNGKDLFYIYAPNTDTEGAGNFRMVEGYLLENRENIIPVELFPYTANFAVRQSGQLTDKNGFYWFYTTDTHAPITDVRFVCKLNCIYPTTFSSPTNQQGNGWRPNNVVYLSDHNGEGLCNRILQKGRITNLDGTIGYSSISISIVDGATIYTDQNGEFTLVVHNGQNTLRNSNVYVNAGGNFQITILECGEIPLFYFQEALAPCVNCEERIMPLNINLAVNVLAGGAHSLKEGARYSVGAYCGDYAGRLQYVNIVSEMYVPSFLERNNLLPSYFRLLINGILNLNPDMKWFTPTVSKNLTQKRYVDWVGDKISYIDNQGNVIQDPVNAVFAAIYIQSLYDYNVNNNFNILAKYQFQKGDMVRILDDGSGNLRDVTTYGDPIVLQVWGTNYNQAAINAGLIPPQENTVFNTTAAQTEFNTSVTLIVKYDSRLNDFIDKQGFWIEIYTPAQTVDVIKYNESAGFYPIIDGEVSQFVGYDSNGRPLYNYPSFLDIDFWDTYLITRNINIPDEGDKYFNHPFNSPNVNDSFGANLISGGRLHTKDDNAAQLWYRDDTIRSDEFVKGGITNGLATYRAENKKDFKGYAWGGIMAMITQRSVIAFICENDWFITTYNLVYARVNSEGQFVTVNLNNNLGEPNQKIGDNYGVAEEDIATVIAEDKMVFWFDRKNTAEVRCDYVRAVDITVESKEMGEHGGVQSYINTKMQIIGYWNDTHALKDRFEICSGIDQERGLLFLTFRLRRNNTNNPYSYINSERNVNLYIQETLVYSIEDRSWKMFTGFTPEAYGRLKGNKASVEMFAFAAGLPYYCNNTPNNSYLQFFGIDTEPIFIAMFNEAGAENKIFQSVSHDSNNIGWFVDNIFTNEKNSFSNIPLNYFKKKENMYYAPLLRDANSYPNPFTNETWRSMLVDGKRMFGRYIGFKFIGDPNYPNTYRELNNVYLLMAESVNNKK